MRCRESSIRQKDRPRNQLTVSPMTSGSARKEPTTRPQEPFRKSLDRVEEKSAKRSRIWEAASRRSSRKILLARWGSRQNGESGYLVGRQVAQVGDVNRDR